MPRPRCFVSGGSYCLHIFLSVSRFSPVSLLNFARSAFSAVTISTVTILGCIILIPLAYQNVQKLHSNLLNDAHFCKVCASFHLFMRKFYMTHFLSIIYFTIYSHCFQSRNRDLWGEVVTVSLGKGHAETAERIKRQAGEQPSGRWLFGHFITTNAKLVEIDDHLTFKVDFIVLIKP